MLKDQWSVETDSAIQELIVAGKTVAIGSGNRISLIDIDSRKVTCSVELDGIVRTLAAAEGRLYASTDNGAIYCLGDPIGEGSRMEIKPRPKTSPYPKDGPAGRLAEKIIRETGIAKGYCLDLGCGDGALAFELARRTDLYIVAVDADPANVRQARQKLDAAGVYGVRVTVLQRNPEDTHLPDYFANLIVSSASFFEGIDISTSAEIDRLQRPCGGIVCLGKPGAMTVDTRGELVGAGSWTHPLADPGNTICSGDKIVKGPLGVLWYRDETLETIDRHGKNPSPLFYEGVLLRQATNAIEGIDAYNGHVIWHKSMPGLLDAYLGGSGVGGIVLAPDDSRACRCAYQNQATLALIQHGVRPPRITAAASQSAYKHDLQKRSHTFAGKLEIVMSHPQDGVQIRYTTDDTYPTRRSPLYTAPITLERTTAVRASVFEEDRKLAVRDAIIFTKVDELETKKRERR